MDFIRKPVNLEQLVITIEAALARSKEMARLQTASATDSPAKDDPVQLAAGIIMERFKVQHSEAQNLLKLNATRQGLAISEAARTLIKATDNINRLNSVSAPSA